MEPTQGDLYADAGPRLVDPADRLEAAALKFHEENPHILKEIAAVALRVKRLGRKHWSINAAFEVVRYNAEVSTSGRTYKLNNNHRAHYARWLMRDVPELAGFFSTREQGRTAQAYDE